MMCTNLRAAQRRNSTRTANQACKMTVNRARDWLGVCLGSEPDVQKRQERYVPTSKPKKNNESGAQDGGEQSQGFAERLCRSAMTWCRDLTCRRAMTWCRGEQDLQHPSLTLRPKTEHHNMNVQEMRPSRAVHTM
jgi:hypothetical protein